MNKVIASLFGLAVVVAPVKADVGAPAPAVKDLEEVIEEVNYVETAKSGIVLSGYVDAGYIYNFTGQGFAARAGDQDSEQHGDFNLNAVKLVLEKPLSDANELQAGFRVDMVYGEDASSVYGGIGGADSGDAFALEQAYVNFRMPVLNGVDVTVGKFVTWLGYDVFERPANLHITYGNLFWNAIPADHTGISFTTSVNDTIDDIGFAVVNTVNADDGLAADGSDTIGLMAKMNITNQSGNANWYNAVYYGVNDSSVFPGSGNNDDVFIWDTWGNWAPEFADDKLLLAFNVDLGFTGGSNDTYWYGVALESKYQFTDIFSLAGRADYFYDADGQKTGIGSESDIWSYTLTAGFDLLENLLLRAEYRVDIGNDVAGAGDDVGHTLAAQAVYSF